MSDAQEGIRVQVARIPEDNCRQHHLLSETSPDLPPRGYFDCTVEVKFPFRLLKDSPNSFGRCYLATRIQAAFTAST